MSVRIKGWAEEECNVDIDKKLAMSKPKCDTCGKYFSREDGLDRHMEIHNQQAISKSSCEVCGKSYTRHDGLLRHIKQKHSNYQKPK